MDLEKIRGDFPCTQKFIYLDNCSTSIPPLPAVEAVKQFAEDLALKTRQPDEFYSWEGHIQKAIREAAGLIGAAEDEIALIKNTSEGLNTLAHALPWSPSDNLVLNDLEYMGNVQPWLRKQQELGFEIRVVKNHRGRLDPEDFRRLVDDRTRAVAISSVQWNNGFRVDLETISGIARSKGAWLVVDAIQQLGALRLNVQEVPVDVLVAGGHKWLLNPFGCGFLYCRRALLDRLKPLYPSWTNIRPPQGNWNKAFASSSYHSFQLFPPVESARRLEVGGFHNFVGAIGLGSALCYIQAIGMEAVEDRILQLTDRVIAGLQDLGFKITSVLDREHRSGIVSFAGDEALLGALTGEGIRLSLRYSGGEGGIRISPHFFNQENEIDRLVEILHKYR